jgi:protein TonB
MTATGSYLSQPLLIALICALLAHILFIFGPHVEFPRAAKTASSPIAITLIQPEITPLPAQSLPPAAPVNPRKPGVPNALLPNPSKTVKPGASPANAQTGPQTQLSSGKQHQGRTPTITKPDFSAATLSQQISEVSTTLNQERLAALQDQNIVYLSDITSDRHIADAYERAWQDKVERIGNLNYPEEARREKLSGALVLAVAVREDGTLYSIQIQQSSGHPTLDAAARNIVTLAAPYAPFPPAIAKVARIIVITRTWRFHSDYHLETRTP